MILVGLLALVMAGCPKQTPVDGGAKTIKGAAPDPAKRRLQVAEELLRSVPSGNSGILLLDIAGIYRAWEDASRLANRTAMGKVFLQQLRKETAKEDVPVPWTVEDLTRMGIDPSGPAMIYGERLPVVVLPVRDATRLRAFFARGAKKPADGWRTNTVKGRTIHALGDLRCHEGRGRMTCSKEGGLLAALEGKHKRSMWDDFAPAERADLARATAAFFIEASPYLGTGTVRLEDDGLSARVRVAGGAWNKLAAHYKGLGAQNILGLAAGAGSTIYARVNLAALLSGNTQVEMFKSLGLDADRLRKGLTGEVMLLERDKGMALLLGCKDRQLSQLLVAVLATLIQQEAKKKGRRGGTNIEINRVKGPDGDYRLRITSTNPAVPILFEGRLRAGKAGVFSGTEKLVLELSDRQPPAPRAFVKGLPTAAAREVFGPRSVAGFHAGLSDPVEALASRYPQMIEAMKNIDPKMRPYLTLGRLLMDQLHMLTLGAVRDDQTGLRLVLRVSTLHRRGVAGDDEARELWNKGVEAKLKGDLATYAKTLATLERKYPGSRFGRLKAVRADEQGTVAMTMGILSAVAIPAFIKYVRKSKTVEATEALDKIRAGARQYFVTDHWDQNGKLLPNQFPPSIPMTPSTIPGCNKKRTPERVWSSRGWDKLFFSLSEPHFYSYSFVSSGIGKDAVFTAKAHGDLDCDGTLSTYELRGSVDSQGEVRVVGPIITNEIE